MYLNSMPKVLYEYFEGPPLVAITAAKRLGIDANSLWSSKVLILFHTDIMMRFNSLIELGSLA